MKLGTISKLDHAREVAGVPFVINSGFRDDNHPETIKNPTSSHNKGYAADIRFTSEYEKERILYGLRQAGFTRIGIDNTFIHADDDPHKTQNVVWYYDGRPTEYLA
jgi:hypothetical protein